ncbi:23S rRNA (uracil(1939)-C(5))-methyltransferase RlmD [Candidatus Dojkabacteria bacterium]|uniref:23S rRNA (Uracil(1939)-C(5))-methyltransferase RlmD n=1 Tax=Candidatus Dojkabacteria bacterium TaxID=2099670 RepID=A0A955I9L7_9BACT|nr:23S rRNA (uracil(1939)-C(5))-methyltransferase RlmD [Candidatus Dojkabacteria bacterium]
MAITSGKQLKQRWNEILQQETGLVTPRCRHFGECGGCSLQQVTYARQVELKQQVLSEIFAEVDLPEQVVVVPSPQEYEYRLRMDYAASFDPFHLPNNRLGLRRKKRFNHVIDLGECFLVPVDIFPKLRQIFDLALELEIPVYDLVSSKGWLRYFVIRQLDDQRMLSIIAKDDSFPEKMEKLAALALELGFTSVHWLANNSDGDTSTGEPVRCWGEEFLHTQIKFNDKSLLLDVGPFNFFQNNIAGFCELMLFVTEFIDRLQDKPQSLLDLYSGVGTIGIMLAHLFRDVYAIELEQSNVELANHNAKLNNIENIRSFHGDAGEFTQHFPNQDDALAIVDPPRAGLETRGVAELLKLRPKYLVYISCNPITQARDLTQLTDSYDILAMKGYDLFPQTLHLENVCILKLSEA